ncbi:WD40 repeat-like protein [Trametes sanguinea]|nr:WD40 repeat-like protein [Trametes sanguinea]
MRYIQARTFAETHTQGITSVLFAPDGALLATSDLSGKMCIWDSSSGKLLHVYTAGTSILALSWGGLDEIVCGMVDGAIMRVTFGSEEVSVTGKWCHAYPVEHLAMSNTYLASGARDELFIWRLRDSKSSESQAAMHKELTSPVASDGEEVLITGLHWDPTANGDVQYLITTYMNQGVFIFDARTWTLLRNFDNRAAGVMARSSLSPDGSRIVVSNLLSGFDVYDVESGSLVLTLFHKVSKQYPVPVVYGHGGHAIISGSTVGVIDIWYIEGTLSRKMTSLRVPGTWQYVLCISY